MAEKTSQFRLATILGISFGELITNEWQDMRHLRVSLQYIEERGQTDEHGVHKHSWIDTSFFPASNNNDVYEAEEHLHRPNELTLDQLWTLCGDTSCYPNVPKNVIGEIENVPSARQIPWYVMVKVSDKGYATFERPSAKAIFEAEVTRLSNPQSQPV